MAYSAEKDFIIKELHRAAVLFCERPTPERIASKSAFDVVTDIDTGVEAKLIKAIKFAFPEDTIISEEKYPRVKPGERTWVIDPIDGTSNMAHGSPLYGLQAAFCVNGEPVLAAINLPGLGLKLHAIKGEGAYLNNKRIVLKPFESTLSTVSFGDFSHKSVKVAKAQARAMRKLYPLLGKIRHRRRGPACEEAVGRIAGRAVVRGGGAKGHQPRRRAVQDGRFRHSRIERGDLRHRQTVYDIVTPFSGSSAGRVPRGAAGG